MYFCALGRLFKHDLCRPAIETKNQGSARERGMISYLSLAQWVPYVAGAGIGLLICLAFILSDRPIGCSTAYVMAGGLIERALRGDRVNKMEYYRKFVPAVGWQFMIVPGIVIGAFISSYLTGTFSFDLVPPLWADTFGETPLFRILVALAGGTLLGIGSRWAGGCTSGHGLSGSLQLSLGSIISAICFFAGGIVTAMLLFHGV
ncbi:MAG TPA: YeeE/YedE thiosulfate transporter family protein [Methanoregulaceae archaeon]|nr:YeeE/YedE thiosulfate transporter family protein [Methanoregulaceae archaeon]